MVRPAYSKSLATLSFYEGDKAAQHLSAVDDDLRQLIERVGEVHVEIEGDGFLSLARAIVDQQISMAAARTIWGRVENFCEGEITPGKIAEAEVEALRSCGLSGRKTEYLKDLSAHVLDGSIDFEQLAALSDAEIIAELVAVRGIGRWTAEMFLIFSLSRDDVFALDDGGLRRAVCQLKGLPTDVPKQAIEAIAEVWSPYRTAASLFLWRYLNNAGDGDK